MRSIKPDLRRAQKVTLANDLFNFMKGLEENGLEEAIKTLTLKEAAYIRRLVREDLEIMQVVKEVHAHE